MGAVPTSLVHILESMKRIVLFNISRQITKPHLAPRRTIVPSSVQRDKQVFEMLFISALMFSKPLKVRLARPPISTWTESAFADCAERFYPWTWAPLVSFDITCTGWIGRYPPPQPCARCMSCRNMLAVEDFGHPEGKTILRLISPALASLDSGWSTKAASRG